MIVTYKWRDWDEENDVIMIIKHLEIPYPHEFPKEMKLKPWHCGYAAFNFTYDMLPDEFEYCIQVNGGITCNKYDTEIERWVYGFDCAHYDDENNPNLQNIEYLKRQIKCMIEQIKRGITYNNKYKRLKKEKSKEKLREIFKQECIDIYNKEFGE